MRSKRPTILDVARHAGVSKSTVSLVLQQSPLVKASTREAVEASIGALGYVYNRSAASLSGSKAKLVGLVINDLRNPFFTELATSAQMTFLSAGYATVVANTDEDPGIQAKVVEAMIENGVSALVISPAYGGDASVFDLIERSGTPTLQVLRQVDPRTHVFPFASLDYATGGEHAVRHLVAQGCRNIAFVGGLEDRAITLERMAGYRKVMAELGRDPVFFAGRPSRVFGRALARRLGEERPEIDGVACFNDLVALGLLSGFAEMGIRLGGEVRLVGFDDIEESSLVYPQLTSVRCDVKRFGEAAAAAMIRWIDGGRRPPDTHRAPVDLVVRASSGGPGAATHENAKGEDE